MTSQEYTLLSRIEPPLTVTFTPEFYPPAVRSNNAIVAFATDLAPLPAQRGTIAFMDALPGMALPQVTWADGTAPLGQQLARLNAIATNLTVVAATAHIIRPENQLVVDDTPADQSPAALVNNAKPEVTAEKGQKKKFQRMKRIFD